LVRIDCSFDRGEEEQTIFHIPVLKLLMRALMIRKYFSKKSDLKKSDLKTVIKFFVHRDMDILMRLDEKNKYLI
jgi:hypothetical protein